MHCVANVRYNMARHYVAKHYVAKHYLPFTKLYFVPCYIPFLKHFYSFNTISCSNAKVINTLTDSCDLWYIINSVLSYTTSCPFRFVFAKRYLSRLWQLIKKSEGSYHTASGPSFFGSLTQSDYNSDSFVSTDIKSVTIPQGPSHRGAVF